MVEAQRENRGFFAYTGAGLSREAGVPTFRGEDGLWQQYDPSEVATPEAFRENPDRVWDFYQQRREQLEQIEPSLAHEKLSEMEKNNPEFRVVTQNVDDLHERAGQDNLVHVHGKITADRCNRCDQRQPARSSEQPPECENCGGLMRPDVVWFGESLPASVLETVEQWFRVAEVVLVVGCSLTVAPASRIPSRARNQGATVYEVNPNPAPALNIPEEQRFQAGANKFFDQWEEKFSISP